MKRRETVVVEVEAWVPRQYERKGLRHTTAKRYRTWVALGRWPVLFRNREVILVKQFGSICLYGPDGEMDLAGFNAKHPKAHLVPERHGFWRLAPESVVTLRDGATWRAWSKRNARRRARKKLQDRKEFFR
jgi:hypothetical protein